MWPILLLSCSYMSSVGVDSPNTISAMLWQYSVPVMSVHGQSDFNFHLFHDACQYNANNKHMMWYVFDSINAELHRTLTSRFTPVVLTRGVFDPLQPSVVTEVSSWLNYCFFPPLLSARHTWNHYPADEPWAGAFESLSQTQIVAGGSVIAPSPPVCPTAVGRGAWRTPTSLSSSLRRIPKSSSQICVK